MGKVKDKWSKLENVKDTDNLIAFMKKEGFLDRMAPLHTSHERLTLWKRLVTHWNPPIHQLRDYLGEEAAMYFEWMKFYTSKWFDILFIRLAGGSWNFVPNFVLFPSAASGNIFTLWALCSHDDILGYPIQYCTHTQIYIFIYNKKYSTGDVARMNFRLLGGHIRGLRRLYILATNLRVHRKLIPSHKRKKTTIHPTKGTDIIIVILTL